jgi:hypothetical protein
MVRPLKVVGLALLGGLTLSALGAQAACATNFLHSHLENTVLTATQDEAEPTQVLTLPNNAGEVKGEAQCKELKLEGTASGAKHEGALGATFTTIPLTVHPIYGGCEFLKPFKAAATVTTGTCHLQLGTETSEEHGGETIECGTGSIEISTPSTGCVISIASQTPQSGVHYTNVKPATTSEWDITGNSTLTALSYTSNFACQLAGIPASSARGELKGKFTAKGYEDLGGSTGEYKEGPQTGIWWGEAG